MDRESVKADAMEHDETTVGLPAYPSKAEGYGSGDLDTEFTEAEQKRIMRRLDRRLITTAGIMYCVSLIDRTNLGNANIAGMAKELEMIGPVNGIRYAIVTLIFFVTYVLFQPPSTIIVRKIGPRIHLSLITLLWGATMLGMGFVKDWEALAGLRVLLGVLEAGFFPSCVYLLSTWYTRYEVGKKYALFYLLGCVAAAFAGILAFGLMQMDGLSGYSGWRWIFIMEGLITCLVGIAGYWLLVDFPDSARGSWRFLGERERAWIIRKVDADRGDAQITSFSMAKYLRAGMDWKVWAYAMIFFNTTTITYALAFFLPIILTQNMKFSVGAAQCLVAPPYAFAGIVMYATAWVGDRYKVRGPIVVFNNVLCLIGLPIVGFHPSAAVRYFGVFLVTAGANSNVPGSMSYQANNIRGQWKRAFCSATLVGFGGIGGICGSLVFRSQDAPDYRPGAYACIACSLLSIVLVGVLSIDFYFQNRKADRDGKLLEDNPGEEEQPSWRYTY